jgi:succinate-acetate transporter protein
MSAEPGPTSEPTAPPPSEVRVVLRPLASPFALGFLALAGAAIMTAGLHLGWVDGHDRLQVGILVLIFTPVPQLIASVFGFLCRDPVAGTGMAILAATWGVQGASYVMTPPGSTSHVLGTLLIFSAVAVALIALEAASGKLAPAAVLSFASLSFLLTGIYELAGGAGIRHAAGAVEIALTAIALYAASSMALEDLQRRTVLPTGRRGAGRLAMTEGLEGQLRHVANEAGVRSQL